VDMLLQKLGSFIYFNLSKKIFLYLKINVMKNQSYQGKSALSLFFSHLAKNFVALFESGNKRDFQRLKDFITS
jgi:hypothetical protein